MSEKDESKKILVIDDDPTVIKLLESILGSKGYEVLLAREAPLGLEAAMKKSPHLIILDVMMPIINGYNICRLLKSEEETRNIPIVLLTSRSGEEDQKIGEEVGADAYFAKPFNTEALLNKILELLKIS